MKYLTFNPALLRSIAQRRCSVTRVWWVRPVIHPVLHTRLSHLQKTDRMGKGQEMKVQMQQPELTSSFLLPRFVWLHLVSGLSLLNCIQDHHVSLWWCECGKQRENQSQGTLLSLRHTERQACTRRNVQTHTYTHDYSFSYLQDSLYSYSVFSFCLTLTHKSAALLISSLTRCQQKSSIYPLWETAPLPVPPCFF